MHCNFLSWWKPKKKKKECNFVLRWCLRSFFLKQRPENVVKKELPLATGLESWDIGSVLQLVKNAVLQDLTSLGKQSGLFSFEQVRKTWKFRQHIWMYLFLFLDFWWLSQITVVVAVVCYWCKTSEPLFVSSRWKTSICTRSCSAWKTACWRQHSKRRGRISWRSSLPKSQKCTENWRRTSPISCWLYILFKYRYQNKQGQRKMCARQTGTPHLSLSSHEYCHWNNDLFSNFVC